MASDDQDLRDFSSTSQDYFNRLQVPPPTRSCVHASREALEAAHRLEDAARGGRWERVMAWAKKIAVLTESSGNVLRTTKAALEAFR